MRILKYFGFGEGFDINSTQFVLFRFVVLLSAIAALVAFGIATALGQYFENILFWDREGILKCINSFSSGSWL